MAEDEEADAEDSGEAEAPPKKSRKKLVIAIVIAALLVGGAVSYVFLFTGGADSPGEEGGSAEETAEETPPPPPPELHYISLERMPAPVTDAGGEVVGYRFLDLRIETHSQEDMGLVRSQLPRVQDAFMRAFTRNGVGLPDQPGVLDYDRVSAYLTDAGNAALSQPVIQNVLIIRELGSTR